MSKENSFLTGLAVFLLMGTLLDSGTMDGIFIAITVGFFLGCIAYVEWCNRL